ncbi:hypothetical protein [Nocardia spumae]|uniref:hypothetical protein n=1 Tax=Nocardia spumae TaxID=2887190 RepID=UPI001D13B666|nr:hypothetical protein [Nocardia spumae]
MPVVYSLALALIVVGPLLGSGYLLLRDAVSTPRSYATDAALGLGDAAPRAVPQDGLLAALSVIVDGGIVVKIVLVVALTAAGWGAARLARALLRVSLAPQLVAATVAIWNPYVAERLLQGHWSLLTGYAALPWTVLFARRIGIHSVLVDRMGTMPALRRWLMLAGVLAAAGLTPTGSLLAGLVAVLTVGRRNLLGTIGVWLLSASPWLVATALSGSGAEPSDPAGVAAFAARAEPGLGTLASLAGLGGIWNGDAVPDSRTTWFAIVATLVLLGTVLSGVFAVATAGDPATRHPRRMLLALAAVSILLPALGATAWGLSIGESVIEWIPGAGLLRDTQKYVALAMPAFALCAAAGCRTLAACARRGGTKAETSNTVAAQPLVAVLYVAALILTLPDLAWGIGGALRPVHYPAAWQRVADIVDGPGDVAVLPAGMFREFPRSGRVPVLDPAPRMLRSNVLQTGVLPVRGQVVAGEGARAQRVENLLLSGAPPAELAARGVGWILVEHRTPGALGDSNRTVAQMEPVYSDDDLTLYRIPGVREVAKASPGDRAIALTTHALWAALLLGGLVAAVIDASIGRRRSATIR